MAMASQDRHDLLIHVIQNRTYYQVTVFSYKIFFIGSGKKEEETNNILSYPLQKKFYFDTKILF